MAQRKPANPTLWIRAKAYAKMKYGGATSDSLQWAERWYLSKGGSWKAESGGDLNSYVFSDKLGISEKLRKQMKKLGMKNAVVEYDGNDHSQGGIPVDSNLNALAGGLNSRQTMTYGGQAIAELEDGENRIDMEQIVNNPDIISRDTAMLAAKDLQKENDLLRQAAMGGDVSEYQDGGPIDPPDSLARAVPWMMPMANDQLMWGVDTTDVYGQGIGPTGDRRPSNQIYPRPSLPDPKVSRPTYWSRTLPNDQTMYGVDTSQTRGYMGPTRENVRPLTNPLGPTGNPLVDYLTNPTRYPRPDGIDPTYNVDVTPLAPQPSTPAVSPANNPGVRPGAKTKVRPSAKTKTSASKISQEDIKKAAMANLVSPLGVNPPPTDIMAPIDSTVPTQQANELLGPEDFVREQESRSLQSRIDSLLSEENLIGLGAAAQAGSSLAVLMRGAERETPRINRFNSKIRSLAATPVDFDAQRRTIINNANASRERQGARSANIQRALDANVSSQESQALQQVDLMQQQDRARVREQLSRALSITGNQEAAEMARIDDLNDRNRAAFDSEFKNLTNTIAEWTKYQNALNVRDKEMKDMNDVYKVMFQNISVETSKDGGLTFSAKNVDTDTPTQTMIEQFNGMSKENQKEWLKSEWDKLPKALRNQLSNAIK